MNPVNTNSVRLKSVVCGLFLTVLTVPAAAQAPAPNPPAINLLDRDARLDRAITVDETGIALKDLLRQLSDLNVTLTPAPLCAEQKVQVHLKHRSLRALMSALAELLAGSWQPSTDKKGYRFSQTEATVQRRKRWWSLFMGEHDPAMANERAYIRQYMRGALPAMHYSSSNPATEAADIQRMRTQHNASHEFFAHLSPEIQEQLIQRIDNEAYLSNSPIVGGSELVEGSLIFPMQDLPQATRDAVASAIASLPYAKPPFFVPTYLRLHNSGQLLQAFFLDAAGTTHGEVQAAPFRGSQDFHEALQLNQVMLARAVKTPGKQVPPAWKELAAYQNSVVWKNEAVAPAFNHPVAPPHRSEVLSWMAAGGKFEFVADYYSLPFTAWTEEDQKQALPLDIEDELNFRAQEQDMSWKRRPDKILLFRDDRWYRNDALEVPNDLLERWAREQAEIDQAGTQTSRRACVPIPYAKRMLDFRVEIVSKLTPWQITHGFKYAVLKDVAGREGAPAPTRRREPPLPRRVKPELQLPFHDLAGTLTVNPGILALYGNLSDEQRLALLGGTLPFAALSAANQERARYVQPMVTIAERQTALLKSNPPLLLGLAHSGAGINTFLGGATNEMIVPNQTGVHSVMLAVTTPPFAYDPIAK